MLDKYNKIKKDNNTSSHLHYTNNLIFDNNLPLYFNELFPHEYIDDKKLLPNQFYYIVDVVNTKIIYTSRQITNILGYSAEEWNTDILFKSIHPDDFWFVSKAIEAGYIAGQNPEFKISWNSSLVVNYRIRHRKGHYIHLLRYATPIKNDRQEKMVYNQSLCTDISDLKTDNSMTCKLYKGGKVIFEMDSNEDEIDLSILTKREKEIVEHINKNLTSEEIASTLFVSKHTVDTHRRRILKKLNIKNTTELLIKLNNRR